jgi:hypothetical protein
MLVQVAILSSGGQGNALLAHVHAATDILATDLDRSALIRPHQQP